MGPIVEFQLVELPGPSSARYHKFCCVYCTDFRHMSACVTVLKYRYIKTESN